MWKQDQPAARFPCELASLQPRCVIYAAHRALLRSRRPRLHIRRYLRHKTVKTLTCSDLPRKSDPQKVATDTRMSEMCSWPGLKFFAIRADNDGMSGKVSVAGAWCSVVRGTGSSLTLLAILVGCPALEPPVRGC